MLSDTQSDLDKLNLGEYSKHQLFSSKIYMAHDYIIFFKDKTILNGSSVIQSDQDALGTPSATSPGSTRGSTASTIYVHQMVKKMLSDALSDLVKLNHGEYRKYHLCSSKFDMAIANKLIFRQMDLKWYQDN